jgi:hypothetical protein
MHHFPEILRLGVLLMEIALRDRMGKIKSSLSPLKQNNKSQRNSTLIFAAHLYNECALRFPSRSLILQVFQRCKDHLRWIDFTKPKDVSPYDDQNFVAIIYRDIARPLEEALLRDTKQSTPHDIFSLKEVLEEPLQDPLVSEPILPLAPYPKIRTKSRWKGNLPVRSRAPSPSHRSVLADISGCKCSMGDGYVINMFTETLDFCRVLTDIKTRKRWEDEWYDENLTMHDFTGRGISQK